MVCIEMLQSSKEFWWSSNCKRAKCFSGLAGFCLASPEEVRELPFLDVQLPIVMYFISQMATDFVN